MYEQKEVTEIPGDVVDTVDTVGNSDSVDTVGAENNGENQKKRKTRLTFDKLVVDFKAALEISGEDETFRDIIEFHGYSLVRREEGLTLISDTAAADLVKKDKKAEQHEATRVAQNLKRKAERTLAKCISSARLAFEGDPNMLEILGLTGIRDRTFGGWAAFGGRVFEKSLETPERQAQLAKYNVPLEMLQQGQQEMADAVEADKVKRSKKADAQVATAAKNELYRKLRQWMKDYYKVVEIAFRENPQLKEKVGIVVPYLR